jgi:hypothetical protein
MEQLVFHILKNAEKKYGVKKQTLYEKLTQHNPFGNLKTHSITSLNMLKSVKDGLKHRMMELQENLRKSIMNDSHDSK